MLPVVSPSAMEIEDSDISSEVFEYYEESSDYNEDSPAYNEEEQITDPFDAGQVTDGIDMSDSGISYEITEDYEETIIVDEYSDPANDEVVENAADPFDTGMSTDVFYDSIVYSDQDLFGNEDELQVFSEPEFWDESAADDPELSWVEETENYSEGLLTEEQIKSLRWFWTKNENQVYQDGDQEASEEASYLEEAAETVTEDISYVFEAAEDYSYSSGEAGTVTEDYSSDAAEYASDVAVFEGSEEPVESAQEYGNADGATYQTGEVATVDIETNSAIISGINLEISYDDEQKIWCLPVPGNGLSSDELIAMLPDGVYLKDRNNAFTVSGWNCSAYISDDDGKWPENGEFLFDGVIDSIGSISILVTLTAIEDDLIQDDIAVEDIDLANTQETPCGDNLTWNYEAGELTISGTGDMYDFRYEGDNDTGEGTVQDAPWAQYKANIEKVIINNGVTSIGNAAFWQCSALTSVAIPNTVTRIGRCAFAECSSLASINLPNNIRKIEYRTFYMCTNLSQMNVDADNDSISAIVTFKVVNGSWNDGTTEEKTVTLTGFKGDTLSLAANQIPGVGSKPADGYNEGSWNVEPSTGTAITENTTYTYTYAAKGSISATVTFKVANGSWNDETLQDKTVELTGLEGDILKLTVEQIPAVGSYPDDGYRTGTWDVEPSTDAVITENTIYTYTYSAKGPITATVTFKVENGSWNDGTTGDKSVTLTEYGEDELKLTAGQIPAVGKKPGKTFVAGSWDVEPSTDIAITTDTTYTYSYKKNLKVTAPTAKKLTYNGQEQDLVSPVKITVGTAEYALDEDETWKEEIPTGINAGTYTVHYRVTEPGYNVTIGSVSVEIKKKDVTVSGIKAYSKIYDGTTNASLNYDDAVIDGTLNGDKPAFTAIGTFANASAGKAKKVTISGLTLEEGSNYQLASKGQQKDTTADIDPKEVTVSGITAKNKKSDKKTSATLDFSNVEISGKVPGDILTVTATGTFEDAEEGYDKDVYITGLALSGKSAGNYQIAESGNQTTAKANIEAIAVTAKGFNGVYDGKEHSISVTTKEKGVWIEYSNTEEGPYNTTNPSHKNAGVYSVYYKVTDKDGVTLSKGHETVNISKKEVKVSGIKAEDKSYDGDTKAVLDCTSAKINGILKGDTLTITATGEFVDPEIGKNKKVIISEIGLENVEGSYDAGNYTLAATGQQTEAKASITPLPYSITYYDVDEENLNPTSNTVESAAIKLKNPTRRGYEFTGWTGEGYQQPNKNVTIPKGTEGPLTYTAHWEITKYTITYKLEGGTDPENKSKYTVEDEFTLTNPTREGYNFLGWTGTDLTEPDDSVTIEKGSTGNRTYTAVWIEKYFETNEYAMFVGDTLPLNIESDLDLGGSSTVKATSSNTSVATASVKGDTLTITAKKIGESTVKVVPTEANGYRTDCKIYVIGKKPTVKLKETKKTVYTCDGSFELVLQVTSDVEPTCTYESSNPSVATVADGIVDIVGPGTTDITAMVTIMARPDGSGPDVEPAVFEQSVTCALTVKEAIFTLSALDVDVNVNKTKTVTVKATPAAKNIIIDKIEGEDDIVTWKMSGTKITFTGKKQGYTRIKVTVNGISYELDINVQ